MNNKSDSSNKSTGQPPALKGKTVDSLHDCPAVANAFMMANSTLPSPGVVERIFGADGQIVNPG
jgi:hypothetical protein